jgi:hypothetical protein
MRLGGIGKTLGAVDNQGLAQIFHFNYGRANFQMKRSAIVGSSHLSWCRMVANYELAILVKEIKQLTLFR